MVFLSACYSESAGSDFLDAGVSHVICIEQSSQIADEACILFSNAFYNAFYIEWKSPCLSFHIAKMIVSCTKDIEMQSSLFTLLTNHKSKNCEGLGIGDLNQIPTYLFKKRFNSHPTLDSAASSNLLWNYDINSALKILNEKRFLIVWGEPGIGKSTFVRQITHFVSDHES